MLEIPPHPLLKKSKSYYELSERYLSDDTHLPFASLPDRDHCFSRAGFENHRERFYTITDIRSGEIQRCEGIYQALGYPDSSFNTHKYINALYPAHAAAQHFYGKALFEVIPSFEFFDESPLRIFVSTVALKCFSGNYVYCKKESIPFLLTAQNKIAACLNEFTVIKPFAGEGYHSRVLWHAVNDRKENEMLYTAVKKYFEAGAGLSVQELRILKRYAASENVTGETIAQAFKIKKNTVNTYHKRILKKAENIFSEHLKDAKQTALFLKKLRLI